MHYWLMKTEPTTYGIDHLAKQPKQTDHWDGVRNYQVRNMMRDDMQVGDQAFFYHSNCQPPGIVGVVKIVRAAYPDHTAFDPDSKYFDPKSDPDNPRWFMVDVRLVKQFNRLIALDELRNNPLLADMLLLRKGNRLSITPLTHSQWQTIMAMT